MKRAKVAQLGAVALAVVIVLGAGGYGIARGVTAKDYSAYNKCISDYMKEIAARGEATTDLPAGTVCSSYRP